MRLFLVIVIFSSLCFKSYSQISKEVDSLTQIYESNLYNEKTQLILLEKLSHNHPNLDLAIKYSDELILMAEAVDSTQYLFKGFLNKGNALRIKGDLTHALENYFTAARIIKESDNGNRLGIINSTIADVYSLMGNHKNSMSYYNQAIAILKIEKDSLNFASALLNAGDELLSQDKLNSASKYFKEAGIIFQLLNEPLGYAYYLGNMGLVYARQEKDTLALKAIKNSIKILEEQEDFYGISAYLAYMSEIYALKEDYNSATKYAEISLKIAKNYGLKQQISDAYLQLSETHEKMGNTESYIKYYKQHIVYKDSLNNISKVQEIANITTDYEVSKKQVQVDLLNEQKRNQKNIAITVSIVLFLVLLLAIGLFNRNKYIKKTSQIIADEKKKSDNLLNNILPGETANELKNTGKVRAKRYESTTVMFTDFKGFTSHSEELSPEQLVESVDYYFSNFDKIIERHGVEKIKTIGDSYMCAAGLPFPDENHAVKVINAAKEIIEFVEDSKNNRSKIFTHYEIRVGINSGPVVAGVVGSKKFAYDIWGDTVNTASRMESSSEPGRINISNSTYNLVKDHFKFERRGEMSVKNKGILQMYFLIDS
ncbi:adenylate/guanylate cyclase domain-containing protein [Urechidicola vernalis]|uniref:Adenylate/guanylate cyclase domain-containing protein n=1 Tax=Urechidicola vernalis TaxID=3075600 RepID=A0ABU2Y2E9_9FLAO|nr:adenylate/guanylate cyclase domain-containing protein [Urechidicola sp. P050]MDT0552207.1 adenylate/guanylate cyclase domain-containing protein [Urechidicola sp. P050]